MMRSGAIVLILTLLAGALRADFRDDYRQGVQAFARQEWSEAARLLRRAMSERPRDEDLRIQVPGTGRIAYVPNALMAIILMRQNDCRGALAYIQSAQDHGISATAAPNYHDQLIEGRKSCATKMASDTAGEANADLGDARRILDELGGLMNRADLKTYLERQPELGQRFESAGEAVDNAKDLLDQSQRAGIVTLLNDARRSARAAKSDVESLRQDVRSYLRSAVAPAVAEAEAAIAAGESASQLLRGLRDDPESRAIWSANPQLGERTRRASRQLEQAKSSLQAARSGADPGPIANVIAAARESTEALTSVGDEARRLAAAARAAVEPEPAATSPTTTVADRPEPEPTTAPPPGDDIPAADPGAGEPSATTPPETATPSAAPEAVPEELRAAAEAYFRGEYRVVLEALAAPAFTEARFQAQAHLFRAASALALYRLEGENEETVLAGAREDAERGLEVDPTLLADPRYFPPAVVELYAAAQR